MTAAGPSDQPRLAGLLGGRLARGLPAERSALARLLRLAEEQIGWGGDGALHAELDIPAGSWRIWPKAGWALWTSRRDGVRAPEMGGPVDLDLAAVLMSLRRRGVWARDLRLASADGWSAPLRTGEAMQRLMTSEPSAISALWFTPERPAVLIEVHRDGQLWASSTSDLVWWAQEVGADDA